MCTDILRQVKRVKKEQRQKKMSEYGTQLLEKQKLRAYYNLLERQFVRYYDRAKKMEGVTGENMLKLLECRLDNIVYRIGFANSIRQARQMVNHGHILVDGKRCDIPSAPRKRWFRRFPERIFPFERNVQEVLPGTQDFRCSLHRQRFRQLCWYPYPHAGT